MCCVMIVTLYNIVNLYISFSVLLQLLPSKNWVDLPFHGGECGKRDAMCVL